MVAAGDPTPCAEIRPCSSWLRPVSWPCRFEQEAQKFTRAAGVYSMCMYGGTPKGPQIGMLRRGVDIIVATPGRCNDLAEMGVLNLARCQVPGA